MNRDGDRPENDPPAGTEDPPSTPGWTQPVASTPQPPSPQPRTAPGPSVSAARRRRCSASTSTPSTPGPCAPPPPPAQEHHNRENPPGQALPDSRPARRRGGPLARRNRGDLGREVDHWDSATDLQLSRVVTVDADSVRQTCQLGSASALAVTATWHSDTTRRTGGPAPVELGPNTGRLEVPVSLVIPGADVGGTLRLRTRLVLRHPGPGAGVLAPVSVGSVLWTEDQRCAVEGSAGQFPMAVLDFTRTVYPDRAAWALSWGAGRLHEPVLGDFRLLLNSAHPTLLDAVRSGSADPRATAVRSTSGTRSYAPSSTSRWPTRSSGPARTATTGNRRRPGGRADPGRL